MKIPETSFSSVVLPEPLRPTSPSASPGSTSSETSRSAHDLARRRAPPARDDGVLERAVRALARRGSAARRGRRRSGRRARHRPTGSCRRRRSARRRSRRARRRSAGRRSASRSARARMPSSARLLLRLGVDVPADLQMIGHEPDGTDEHLVGPGLVERRRGGRGCPARATARRSATRSGTRTTSRRPRPPAATSARGLEQLVAVRIALRRGCAPAASGR